MTEHYNPSISQDAARTLNTKGDNFPTDVQGLMATVKIAPFQNIVKTNSYTTPTDKDFYMTSVFHSYSKTAANTGSVQYVQFTPEETGIAINTLALIGTTLTAEKDRIGMHFGEVGIKIKRGTTITVVQTGTYAIFDITIVGYTRETTR